LASVFFQLPSLTEKTSGCNTARRARGRGRAQINHRPIRQLRRLARVTRMMRLAEGELNLMATVCELTRVFRVAGVNLRLAISMGGGAKRAIGSRSKIRTASVVVLPN